MVLTDIGLQFKLITVSIGIGFLIGVVFDIYRIVRGLIKPGGIITVLGDLLFWIFLTLAVFITLFYSNWGEMRFYLTVIFFIGFTLYRCFLSRTVVSFIRKTINFIENILTGTVGLILWPFKKIFKTVHSPLHKKMRHFKKISLLPSRIIDKARFTFPKIIKSR